MANSATRSNNRRKNNFNKKSETNLDTSLQMRNMNRTDDDEEELEEDEFADSAVNQSHYQSQELLTNLT
ncbi:unnamed protein product [Brachionus calyciflorus]|uniref:Uncharacterized protein n=1 Tax=Brachionus calyciflorus TaxID=104777 RepID=A0A814RHT8_9BILA|nr:unnamed protein product [Brachionus calyciflorus]